jgi:ABC-type transport system involved in multi-copper enzyme maturation permease subunit
MVTHSATVRSAGRNLPWRRWWSQVRAILRLELRKSFLGRRGIGLYLLAIMPVFILAMRMIAGGIDDPSDVAEATRVYAGIYQGFILRVVIFLGSVAVFGNLIRREVLERTLHYYFLTPIRREVLVAAKYLTGLIVTVVLFEISTVLSFFLAYMPHEGIGQFMTRGPGLGHLGAYLLVTFLGCLGYGAVFLAFGFFFKSPAIPALLVFGWEGIHFLLPPMLKKVSVIHYLQSLCPVPLPAGPLAVLSDAPSPWVAIPGLLLLAAILIAVSALRIRKMEISYEED